MDEYSFCRDKQFYSFNRNIFIFLLDCINAGQHGGSSRFPSLSSLLPFLPVSAHHAHLPLTSTLPTYPGGNSTHPCLYVHHPFSFCRPPPTQHPFPAPSEHSPLPIPSAHLGPPSCGSRRLWILYHANSRCLQWTYSNLLQVGSFPMLKIHIIK